jgi:hypothetical protein
LQDFGAEIVKVLTQIAHSLDKYVHIGLKMSQEYGPLGKRAVE